MSVQFRSFEESLALIGALVVAGISYKFFKANALTSILWGGGAAVIVAYVTFFEFRLQDEAITYRNRFREVVLPLEWVKKADVKTFWAGLPGKTYMFLLNSPPAPWAGYFLRTGLVAWPISAERWVEAVNAAGHKAEQSKNTEK